MSTEESNNIRLNRAEKIAIIIGFSPIVLPLLFYLCITIINFEFGEIECQRKRDYLELEFSGKVIEKGIDVENHMFEYIELINSSSRKERIYLMDKVDQLWEKIVVNDYIEKRKESLVFTIERKSKIIPINLCFDCNENDFWINPSIIR